MQSATDSTARHSIRRLAREIDELATMELSAEEFFDQFLAAAIAALKAAGGAVWRVSAEPPELITQQNLQATEIAESDEAAQRHLQLVGQVVEHGKPLVTPPYAGSDSAGNPTRFMLILVPLVCGDSVVGVVELFQRPGASLDLQRSYLTFLGSVCDKASQWMHRQQVRRLAERESQQRQLIALAELVHGSIDLRETAHAIANEARRYIGCDRVSLAIRRGGRYQLASVSGQDAVEQRSNLVVQMRALIRCVLAAGDPCWYSGCTQQLPPQLEQALHAYLDVAQSSLVGVVPLERDAGPQTSSPKEPEIVGALVIEQIAAAEGVGEVRQRTEEVARHAALALANAHDHAQLFLMPLWRMIGHSRLLVSARNLPKTLAVVVAATLAVLVGLLVPARFELEGPAALQPVQRRNVFSELQGVVTEVHADTGNRVEAGARLLTLGNTDLSVRLEDVQGRLSVAVEQLLDYERRLLDSGTAAPAERARWASELAGLRKQAANLGTQLKLLKRQQQKLTIVSPIAGEVITWDARRLLLSRMVLDHRLAAQDPFAISDTAFDEAAEALLLADEPVALAKASEVLGL